MSYTITQTTPWLPMPSWSTEIISFCAPDAIFIARTSVIKRGLNNRVCIHMEISPKALQWRHNERDGVSHHQPLFRRRSKKASKLRRVTGLCDGNSPVTGEFPTQRASNVENVSIFPFDDVIIRKGCLWVHSFIYILHLSRYIWHRAAPLCLTNKILLFCIRICIYKWSKRLVQ